MTMRCRCGGRIIKDSRRGEYFCENCGLVVEETAIATGSLLSFKEKEGCAPMHAGSTTFRDCVYETSRARRIYNLIRYFNLPEVVDKDLARETVAYYVDLIFRQQKERNLKVSDWECIIRFLFENVLRSMGYRLDTGLTGKERWRVERLLRDSHIRIPRGSTRSYIERMARYLPPMCEEKREIVKEAMLLSEKIAGSPSTKAAAAMVIAYMQKRRDLTLPELAKTFSRIINANRSTIIKAVRKYMPEEKGEERGSEEAGVMRMPVIFLRYMNALAR